MARARTRVNSQAGTKRMFAHAVFALGQPGWLDSLDHAIALQPDSFKAYTIGDNTHRATSHYPWRMDDEKLVYPAYERMLAADYKNVCVHKGLFPPSLDRRFPKLRGSSPIIRSAGPPAPTCATDMSACLREAGRAIRSLSRRLGPHLPALAIRFE